MFQDEVFTFHSQTPPKEGPIYEKFVVFKNYILLLCYIPMCCLHNACLDVREQLCGVSVLFHHGRPRDQTKAVKLGLTSLYLTSHFGSSKK